MGNTESSSLGGTAIKVAAVAAAAAAAAAWTFASFSKDTGSRQNPPPAEYEELQMLNIPEDYLIRRQGPIPDDRQIMMLDIDGDDDDDDGGQQKLPLDPIQASQEAADVYISAEVNIAEKIKEIIETHLQQAKMVKHG